MRVSAAGVASTLLSVGTGFSGPQRCAGVTGRISGSESLLASETAAAAVPLRDHLQQATETTREEKHLSHYDQDENGKPDRDEYLMSRRRVFGKLNTNGKLEFKECG